MHTATTADGAVTSYTYTPAGQIATVTQPSGTVTTYTYDPKTGRLAEVDVQAANGSTQQTGYTYDPATGRVRSVYDPAHPDDAINYDYDADGHVVADPLPGRQSTAAATYTDSGKLATSTDITGAVTTYTYNDDGTCGPATTDLCQAVQVRDGRRWPACPTPTTRWTGCTRSPAVTGSPRPSTTPTPARSRPRPPPPPTAPRCAPTATPTTRTATSPPTPSPAPCPPPPRPARPGPAAARAPQGRASPPTTTAYNYDAYNRLLSSAVYPGTATAGTPTTTTAYTLDAAGNVTGQDTTTSAGTTPRSTPSAPAAS